MQNAELLAQHPPHDKQRFNDDGQIGVALDQFPDARLEFQLPDDFPTLRPKLRKVPRRSFSMAMAFVLQQLAMGQRACAELLAA